MTILVDAAIWRWRGRRWAHLVSDTSYGELHDFGRRLGLRPEWFQGDHYDIPEAVREQAIVLGALDVPAAELVQRLRTAGLRRPRSPNGSRPAAAADADRGHGGKARPATGPRSRGRYGSHQGAAMTTMVHLSDLPSLVGQQLGDSAWVTVTQEMIDQFADATFDHQWIHVDPERAAKGPFGTTIAHGYLTLSLLPHLVRGWLDIRGVGMGVNYGLNRCRFPSPVPVGSRVRASGELAAAERLEGGAVQITTKVRVTVEGAAKPSCVAEVLTRYYPAPQPAAAEEPRPLS
ncbi:MAG: DUF4031 domain-containing protein [Nitriliruptorales bacterium]|nr:DUF4031 domain-containing protein [Nitriliruptorales bacterium]